MYGYVSLNSAFLLDSEITSEDSDIEIRSNSDSETLEDLDNP